MQGSITKFVNRLCEKNWEIQQSVTEKIGKVFSQTQIKKNHKICPSITWKKKLATFASKLRGKFQKFTNCSREKIMKFVNWLQGNSTKFVHRLYEKTHKCYRSEKTKCRIICQSVAWKKIKQIVIQSSEKKSWNSSVNYLKILWISSIGSRGKR